MIDFAPGMRAIIRDEEWMVKKILTLLTSLKRAGKIDTDSENKQTSHWILAKRV